MKVIGKHRDSCGRRLFDFERYIALEVLRAEVRRIYGTVDKCYVEVLSAFKLYGIFPEDRDALNPEEANRLIQDIAIKDIVDLDQYNMYLDDDGDKESIAITNEGDSYYPTIPLVVEIKDHNEN